MSKESFLHELERCLMHLPAEDRNEALEYYRDYIDDAIANGDGEESAVIEKLGSAEDLAAVIITDVAKNSLDNGKQNGRKDKNGKIADKGNNKHSIATTIWIVILAIFASPIALPIAIVILVLMLIPIIVVFALIVSFFSIVIAMIPSSFVLLFTGFDLLSSQTCNAIVLIGNGLLFLGAAGFIMLLMMWIYKIAVKALKAIGRRIVDLVNKNKNKA